MMITRDEIGFSLQRITKLQDRLEDLHDTVRRGVVPQHEWVEGMQAIENVQSFLRRIYDSMGRSTYEKALDHFLNKHSQDQVADQQKKE